MEDKMLNEVIENLIKQQSFVFSDDLKVVAVEDLKDAINKFILLKAITTTTITPQAIMNKIGGNDFVKQIKKLELKEQDMVVIRVDSHNTQAGELGEKLAESLRYIFDNTGLEKVACAIVSDKIDVENLGDEQMFKAGWVRKEKVMDILNDMLKDDEEDDNK